MGLLKKLKWYIEKILLFYALRYIWNKLKNKARRKGKKMKKEVEIN